LDFLRCSESTHAREGEGEEGEEGAAQKLGCKVLIEEGLEGLHLAIRQDAVEVVLQGVHFAAAHVLALRNGVPVERAQRDEVGIDHTQLAHAGAQQDVGSSASDASRANHDDEGLPWGRGGGGNLRRPANRDYRVSSSSKNEE